MIRPAKDEKRIEQGSTSFSPVCAWAYPGRNRSPFFVGVVNAANEIVPGHIHLDTITKSVKSGVSMAGGVPFENPPRLRFAMALP